MIDISKKQQMIVERLQSLASDSNFRNDVLIESLFKEFSIKPLAYSSEKSIKNVGEETFSLESAPPNFSFVPGRNYPYVEFDFAIDGNESHIEKIAGSTSLRVAGMTYNGLNSQKYIVCRIFTQNPFIGNEELLESVNQQGVVNKKLILDLLEQFNTEAEHINIALKDFIKVEFEKEKDARRKRKESLDKLNPF